MEKEIDLEINASPDNREVSLVLQCEQEITVEDLYLVLSEWCADYELELSDNNPTVH
jgi:hypothetical protein